MNGIELSGFEDQVRHPPLKLKKNSCFYFAKCKKLRYNKIESIILIFPVNFSSVSKS
jgi:hypothetical protein